MTRAEYNLTGILGAKASIQNRTATAPLAKDISGRSPAFHVADMIHQKFMRATRDVTPASPIIWRLAKEHVPFRQSIIAKLGEVGYLQAIASGMDSIHIVGVYAEAGK